MKKASARKLALLSLRRIPAFVAVAIVVGFFLAPIWQPVSGQEAIQVLDTHVTADFPTSLTFYVKAQGAASITKAEVRFNLERKTCASSESSGFAQFDSGKSIDTSWTWDTRKGGTLPPGAVVHYRWVLQDASGATLETPDQTYVATDARYSWQSIEKAPLTIYWYQGDQAFANSLMYAAQNALSRLDASAGARPDKPVKLFIYGSTDDLHGALVFPEEWTGGVTFGGFNIIVLGITPADLAWGQRAISHELTHVVVGQVTFNCFRDIPAWLAEGLATYNEDPSKKPQASYADALKKALASGQLLSVRGIGGAFPTDPNKAILAYGESFSLIQYLTEKYGPQKLNLLLSLYRSGTATDAALRQVYGFDQDGLDSEWRAYLGAPASAQGTATPTPIAIPMPTFAPYTLASPTPTSASVSQATPTATTVAKESTPTPAARRQGGFGCNAGLPPPTRSTSGPFPAAFMPIGVLALGAVAFVVRRRKP